jgi:hypothetical protein
METVTWGGAGFAVVAGSSEERIVATAAPLAANFAVAPNAWSGADKGTPLETNDNSAPPPPSCPAPIAYGTGKTTSNGVLPTVTSTGTTNDFTVKLLNGMPNQSTIAFWGVLPDDKPFKGGRLYVKAPLQRMPLVQADVTGSVSYAIPVDASMPGTSRYYQFWFRDPFVPDGTNVGLSSALEVNFCPLAPPPSAGQVVITEVMKNPATVTDANGEWFELYNTTSIAIDIEGWTVRDDGTDSFVISNGGNGVLVPAHSYIVLAANGDSLANGGVAATFDYDWNLCKLDNGADELVLVAPGAVEIDRIEYDAGIVWPDFPGAALNLKSSVLDAVGNDDGNNWCPASTPISGTNADTATPNTANTTCP